MGTVETVLLAIWAIGVIVSLVYHLQVVKQVFKEDPDNDLFVGGAVIASVFWPLTLLLMFLWLADDCLLKGRLLGRGTRWS